MKKLNKGLIVSCQALKGEPMYGGDSIKKFAYAAFLAGANGIRANTIKDINGIYRKINGALPIIGIIKKDYKDSEVYITSTLKEVKKLIRSKCDVIALDATLRKRPNDEKLEDLVKFIKTHSNKLIMADCATEEEILNAENLGFDYVSTTLRSYTSETKGIKIPDLEFIKNIKYKLTKSILIVEGGIDSPSTLKSVLDLGIEYVVIGGAITRPLQITKRYLQEFKVEKN